MRKILTLVALVCVVVVAQSTAVSAFTWPWENTSNTSSNNDKVAEQIMSALASGAVNVTTGQALPTYPWTYDDVRIDIYRGVALDIYTAKNLYGSIDTNAAVLMRISHGGQETVYLIVGSEMHKMQMQGIQGGGQNWLIKLSAEDNGQQLLLFAHEGNGVATVSGMFGDRWLINFEPVGIAYAAGQAQPVQTTVCKSSSTSVGCGMIEEQTAPAIPVIAKTQSSASSEVESDGPAFWK